MINLSSVDGKLAPGPKHSLHHKAALNVPISVDFIAARDGFVGGRGSCRVANPRLAGRLALHFGCGFSRVRLLERRNMLRAGRIFRQRFFLASHDPISPNDAYAQRTPQRGAQHCRLIVDRKPSPFARDGLRRRLAGKYVGYERNRGARAAWTSRITASVTGQSMHGSVIDTPWRSCSRG